MTEIFDAQIAIEQAGGNTDLAKELFTMLLKELPELHDAAQSAYSKLSNDNTALDVLWDPVHKIHGSTAYCGVPALREAAKFLEDQIKQNNGTQIKTGMNRLSEEITRLLQEGEKILAVDWG